MHPNCKLLEQFYHCFGQRDYRGMIACYHADIDFRDAVFTLHGKAVGAMWHMLCEAGTDMEISCRDIQADDQTGQAHWEARYTFPATGRPVHNVIEARFVFRDNMIIEHYDTFSLWHWAHMALGPAGWLAGWVSLVQKQIQRSARHNLDRFIAIHQQYRQ
jgi:hypothetical protein